MHIEELGEGESGGEESEINKVGLIDAKRAAVGIGARVLFYPTLLYNVLRNRFESEFHWWDQVDEFLLLGAVPFPSQVLHLKELGVSGVITLNEPYETLVPTSLYLANGIENLVLPTRDYLFAPSFGDLCKAVDFIHKNSSQGKTTYVHCKAGRGRSTTVVLCYLVQYKQMTPIVAYEYVRMRRPRVLLAPSQWQAVQEFYENRVNKSGESCFTDNPVVKNPPIFTHCKTKNFLSFDDSTFVVVSKSDLEGYDGNALATNVRNGVWAELSLVYRVQFGLSYFWLRYQNTNNNNNNNNSNNNNNNSSTNNNKNSKLGSECCSLEAEQVGNGLSCLPQGVVVKL